MMAFLNPDTPTLEKLNDYLDNYGFNHELLDVTRMYAEKVNHKLLGYAGGVIDQPDEYWEDMNTMRLLQQWCEIAPSIPRLEEDDIIKRLKRGGSFGGTLKPSPP